MEPIILEPSAPARHVPRMRFIYRYRSDDHRTLDMTPDGQFRRQPGRAGLPGQRGLPFMQRVFLGAVIVAAVAGGFALSALAFWLAMFLLPVALVAGLVAWGMLKMMSAARRSQSVGGQRDPFRRF
jgi:hypothetical protein